MIIMSNLENLATEIGKDIKDIKTRYATKEEMHEVAEVDYSQIVTHEELEAKHYLTENQTLSLEGNRLSLTNGGSVNLPTVLRSSEYRISKSDIVGDEVGATATIPIDSLMNPIGIKVGDVIQSFNSNSEGADESYWFVTGISAKGIAVRKIGSRHLYSAYNDAELKQKVSALEKRPEPQPPHLTLTGNTLGIAGGNNVTLPLPENVGHEIRGTGSPEGRITAEIGTTYVDVNVTNGALKWIKESGNGNTGWRVLIGDTGWRTLNSVSKLVANGKTSFIKIRRVNNLVTFQFGGLQWGWFGVGRRNGPGFVRHNSSGDKGAKVTYPNGIPEGFRSENSLVGPTYDDKGRPYGIWYLGGKSDLNFIQFTFNEDIPTDRDIGDIRVSAISYLTDEPWPTKLP